MNLMAFGVPRLRAQALAEAALVVALLALLAMLGINLLILHRVQTAALAAAYACAQYITQFPHQVQRAQTVGQQVALQTLSPNAWNALSSASFTVAVHPPTRGGEVGWCTVTYHVTLPFAPPGMEARQGNVIRLFGRSERWQSRW